MTSAQETRVGEMLVRLRESGGRITSGRVAILRALVGGHRSADEILRAVPGSARATVYKTLDALKALGEVVEIEGGDGRAHYDALRPEPHPHAVCTRCGRVEDVEIPAFAAIAPHAEGLGLRVQAVRLDVLVLCADCAENAPA